MKALEDIARAFFISEEYMQQRIACPKCSMEGHMKPNMAVYEDGGKYCFRCEYFQKGDGRKEYKEIGSYSEVPKNSSRWIKGASCMFTNEALGYLYKYRITDQEIIDYGILCIENGWYCHDRLIGNAEYWHRFQINNHLYFPIRDLQNIEVGFQTKSIDPDQKIKSLTSKYNGIYATENFNPNSEEKLFIVEGIIDAICCARLGNCVNAIALLGNSIGETKMLSILKQSPRADNIYLWMDNDQGGEMHRHKIASFFESYLHRKVKHIRTEKDPKYYSPEEMQEIIL